MLFYYCVQCKLWFPLSTAAFVLMLLDRAHRKTSGSALMGTAYEEARLTEVAWEEQQERLWRTSWHRDPTAVKIRTALRSHLDTFVKVSPNFSALRQCQRWRN